MGNLNESFFLTIVSLVFTLVLFFSFHFKEKIENKETKVYKVLLIVLLLSNLFETSLAIFYTYNDILKEVLMRLFLIASVGFVGSLLYYLGLITYDDKKMKLLKIILFSTLAIITATICILPVEYVYEKGILMYSEGPAVTTCIVSLTGLIIVMLVLIIFNKKTKNNKVIPVYIFMVMIIISSVIKMLFPYILLNNMAFGITAFIMFNTIENPDVKLLEYEQKEREKIIQAAESKSEFLSSTSHELRTPLNAIIGLSEDIESFNNINPDILDDVKDLVNASNILLDIISNILDSSKIESGKLDVVESDYYPNKEYENLINVYRVKAFKKNIQLITNMSANIPEVLYGDKQRIKQIIANLLDNAVKFTDAGKVTISLDFNLDNLIISISDTGKGMKEEEVRNFLSPNNDLKIEKVYSSTGTGLGLSITKNLIKILHGTVNMQSTVLVGTKYVISIPQKIGNKEALEEQERDQLVDLSKLNYAGKRLLIVDDNPINIKVLKKAIASYNFEVEECYNGKDAIEKIEINNNYDLVFMDIMMPVMGGEEAMGKLKSMSNFTSPVIALTADAVSGATEKYKALGFNDYLSKPFSRDMVAKKLYSVLGGGETNE